MSSAKSYLPPVPIGGVMRGATLSEVVAVSYNDNNDARNLGGNTRTRLRVGDVVSEFSNQVGGWQEYAIVSERGVRKVETTLSELLGESRQQFTKSNTKIPSELPLTVHLSILGTTGLTAYFGFVDVCSPRPPSASTIQSIHSPETILVTAAAGAVGSIVCQIAKFVYGCKVIGVAGGSKKGAWLKDDLKCCDVVIDYRTMENSIEKDAEGGDTNIDVMELYSRKSKEFQKLLRQSLKQIGSRGFDMVFDNVGGYQLNEVLYRLNPHARVALCGAISGYNIDMSMKSNQQSQSISPTSLHMKHGMALISLRAKIQGFIVLDYVKQWEKAKQNLAQWIVEGKIRYQKEDIREGLESAPMALLDLFNGMNKGKLIIKVGDRITKDNEDIEGSKKGMRSKL